MSAAEALRVLYLAWVIATLIEAQAEDGAELRRLSLTWFRRHERTEV